MKQLAEADLLSCCRKGEEPAWEELFSRHYASTIRFIFQLSPALSLEDAEEICQETFVSVIRNIETFAGHSQLQTWICRIASNKAWDHLEKHKAIKRGGGKVTLSLDAEDAETGLTLDPPSTLPSPDVLLSRKEGMEMVGQALASMGQPCREIIELRYFADLSYDEISLELKLNAKTVSSRLSKCLDKLEKVLALIVSGKKDPVSSV
ncbi:MAG: polymerase, sigma subunit, family [Verrucomicrobiales bacterium]|nr:polymerase, sigma subunit, family [Verrucomicrobiales bacterium]